MNLKTFALSLLGMTVLLTPSVKAQVTSNSSQPPSTTVISVGGGYLVRDFTGQQQNQFHSFSELDTSDGQFINFIANPNVTNVIGRITDAPTAINGLVTVTTDGLNLAPGVNLFLLSPQGISFGPNTVTNVDGAFVASTASSLSFEDGTLFKADTADTPTLTISAPIGLQMGAAPATILVEGINHETPFPGIGQDFRGINTRGNGQNVLLLGGNVDIDSGGITLLKGRLQIAGLSEAGIISLSNSGGFLNATLPDGIARADVSLSKGAQILANGPGESINIATQDLMLSSEPGGLIDEQTSILAGALPGLPLPYQTGDININATGDVSLTDGNIFNAIAIGAVGNTGDINFKSRSLFLTDSAQITTIGLGTGDPGDLNIEVEENIRLDGKNSRPDRLTGLYSLVGDLAFGTGNGQAGNLTIKTNSLDVLNGSLVSSSTLGEGNAGKTTVVADERILVDGVNSIGGVASSISSSVEFTAAGDGGSIDITTPLLVLNDGGSVFGRTQGDGNAGSILLKVNALEATNGGQVVTTSFTEGAAGDIEVIARDRINLTGRDSTYQDRVNLTLFNALGGESSGIYASTNPTSTGSSGSVNINTNQLTLSDTAQLSVSSQGTGVAGSLNIAAQNLQLNNGTIQAESRNGDRGNIQIAAPILLMRDRSLITTNATGNATGGNIMLNTPFIIATGNSDIVARATQGAGGNIDIVSSGLFGIAPRPELTPGNDINASSELGVNGTVAITNPTVDPDSGLVELPENVADPTNQLTAGCSTEQNNFVASGRGGLPQDPTRAISTNALWQDTRPYQPSTAKSQSISQTSESLQVESEASPTEAIAWNRNSANEVVLSASAVSPHPQYLATCASH